MSSVKYLLNYGVDCYKEGSILDIDQLKGVHFYLPLRGIHVEYDTYGSKETTYLIDNALRLLGSDDNKDYYLVEEYIIIVTLLSSTCLNNNRSDDYDDYSQVNYIHLLFDDIKNSDYLSEFNRYGICSFSVNCIIEEHWTYCMDDWDYNIEYIGMVRDDIDVSNLVTDHSKKRLDETRESMNFQYDDIGDFMELSSFH